MSQKYVLWLLAEEGAAEETVVTAMVAEEAA
jgi:hypothetical protein